MEVKTTNTNRTMRHLKRLIFTLLGIAFVTAPAIALIYALTGETKFEGTIGAVIGMSIIGILITVVMLLLGALINKLFEDSNITIFTAFFMISFQKRKRLYHSTMGEFELIIDEKDLEGSLVRQGFFSCLEIASFGLENGKFMENIKQHLDARYKDEIAEKEERKRKRELVKGLMKEEGYLDVVVKRDDRLNKLGL
jgi:small-conductance mechanosensitive channel